MVVLMDAVVLLKFVKVLMEMKHPQNGEERLKCHNSLWYSAACKAVCTGGQSIVLWMMIRRAIEVKKHHTYWCLRKPCACPIHDADPLLSIYICWQLSFHQLTHLLLAANWSTIWIKYFYYSLELYIMNFLLYKRPCISV